MLTVVIDISIFFFFTFVHPKHGRTIEIFPILKSFPFPNLSNKLVISFFISFIFLSFLLFSSFKILVRFGWPGEFPCFRRVSFYVNCLHDSINNWSFVDTGSVVIILAYKSYSGFLIVHFPVFIKLTNVGIATYKGVFSILLDIILEFSNEFVSIAEVEGALPISFTSFVITFVGEAIAVSVFTKPVPFVSSPVSIVD